MRVDKNTDMRFKMVPFQTLSGQALICVQYSSVSPLGDTVYSWTYGLMAEPEEGFQEGTGLLWCCLF